MKNIFLLVALAIAGCSNEPEYIQRRVCDREETRDLQVCYSDTSENVAKGAIFGGIVGHMIGIKPNTGAMVGGAIGAANSGTSKCHIEKEKYCIEYKTIQEPNPRFKNKEK